MLNRKVVVLCLLCVGSSSLALFLGGFVAKGQRPPEWIVSPAALPNTSQAFMEQDRYDVIPGTPGKMGAEFTADGRELVYRRPGLTPQSPQFTPNGRQLVRKGSLWLMVFDAGDGSIYLTAADALQPEGKDFVEAFRLVGAAEAVSLPPGVTRQAKIAWLVVPPEAVLLAQGPRAQRGSLLLDRNRLHVFWHDTAIRHAFCDVPTSNVIEALKNGNHWTVETIPTGEEAAILEDVATDGRGRLWVAFSTSKGAFTALRKDSSWAVSALGSCGDQIRLARDRSGNIHACFVCGEILRFTSWKASGWDASEQVTFGVTRAPMLAFSGNTPLIVYQAYGQKRVQGGSRSLDYNVQREGGGSSVAFAAKLNGAWIIDHIDLAEEITVYAPGIASDYEGETFLTVEEMWAPALTTDQHGIPWVFWNNTTRGHTYFARWLGAGFTDPMEWRGPFYNLSQYVSAQREPNSPSSPDLAVVVGAGYRLFWGTFSTPPYPSRRQTVFPFIDLMDVSELRGLEHRLNEFARYPGNPVFGGPQPEGWTSHPRWPAVRRGGDGVFHMQYYEASRDIPNAIPGVRMASAVRVDNGQVHMPTLNYATSKDGVHWTRPRLGLFHPQRPGDENRIFEVNYFEDEEETDPQKRFKGVLIEGHWIWNTKRPLVYSADALHWSAAGQNAEGVGYMGENSGPSYRDRYDSPDRRFKAVGRTKGLFGGRALGMMYSPDLIHWAGAEPRYLKEEPYAGPKTNWVLWRGRLMPRLILDPLGEANCEQTMWGAVWIEPQYGMYLGLYAPTRFDGKLDLAFAASRDGIHFYRIKNGSRALRFSAGGQWDSGFLEVGAEWTAFSGPIRMGDKVWLYYGGTPYHLGVYGEPVSGRTDRIQGQSYVGIATMRADGWAYLTPSENTEEGSVTTVPFTSDQLGGRTLKVNVDGLDHGRLQAEVLDAATNESLVGYSRKDSTPVLENGVEKPVTWRGHQKLPEDPKRQLKLRFHLQGARARFYGFKLSE